MKLYISKRLLLVLPTLFGILLLNFVVIQAAPGGPVEKTLAELQGVGTGGAGSSFAGSSADTMTGGNYQNAKGLPPELVERPGISHCPPSPSWSATSPPCPC